MKLSILMPVYDEKATLDDILDRVLSALLPEGMEIETVAVDDGSGDGSWEVLEKRAREDGRVRAIRHEKRKGKGSAIRTAVGAATGEICLIQDADLEYDPRDYGRLLKPLLENEADVVYGSRFAAAEYRRVLLYRHALANRFLTGLSNLLTDLNLTDLMTGYKAFRRSVLETMPLRSNGFGFEAEVTAKVAKQRLRVFEVPVSYNGRTYLEGKKIRPWHAFEVLGAMLAFFAVDDLYNERFGEATLRSMELATRFTRWVMDRVRPYLRGTVLEVGSGIGNNVRAMLGLDRVIATDSDPKYVDLLREWFGGRRRVDVRAWDVTQPPPFDVPAADTVLCSNVLEHVENEDAALEGIRAVLRDGGRAVFVVPAGEWLHGTLDEALGHVRRYDRLRFSARLLRAGFRVVDAFSMNRVGVLGWWLNGKRLKRRTLGRYQLKLFDMLVPALRWVDRFLPWEGLSLVVVAEKAAAEGRP